MENLVMKITNRFYAISEMNDIEEVEVNYTSKDVEVRVGDKYSNYQQNLQWLKNAIEKLRENGYKENIHFSVVEINGGYRGHTLYLQENMED